MPSADPFQQPSTSRAHHRPLPPQGSQQDRLDPTKTKSVIQGKLDQLKNRRRLEQERMYQQQQQQEQPDDIRDEMGPPLPDFEAQRQKAAAEARKKEAAERANGI